MCDVFPYKKKGGQERDLEDLLVKKGTFGSGFSVSNVSKTLANSKSLKIFKTVLFLLTARKIAAVGSKRGDEFRYVVLFPVFSLAPKT